MAPPKKISRVAVRKLALAGRSDSEIAIATGGNRASIGKIRRSMGIRSAVGAGGKWNAAEDAELAERYLDGEVIADIAAAMHRGATGVKLRLRTLGLSGQSPYHNRGRYKAEEARSGS